MLRMIVTVQLRQIVLGSSGSTIRKHGVGPIHVAGENYSIWSVPRLWRGG